MAQLASRNRRLCARIAFVLLALTAVPLRAQTLLLKDGRTLEGQYAESPASPKTRSRQKHGRRSGR